MLAFAAIPWDLLLASISGAEVCRQKLLSMRCLRDTWPTARSTYNISTAAAACGNDSTCVSSVQALLLQSDGLLLQAN